MKNDPEELYYANEGARQANKDAAIDLFAPLPVDHELFLLGIDRCLPTYEQNLMVRRRHMYAYVAYRSVMARIARRLLEDIRRSEEIDFVLYGRTWAMMDIRLGTIRQVLPLVCCGSPNANWQASFLRWSYHKFLRGYRMQVAEYAWKNDVLHIRPRFNILLPPKRKVIVEVSAYAA